MKRILIIEDDLVIANIYSNRFRTEGYQVEVAHDGEAGKSEAVRFRPDLVILDLMLPKVNGIEVIKYLRSHADFKTTPIIVFSNSYLSSLVQEAWKAGATKCLSKIDCTPKHLLEVVSNTLQALAPAPAPAPVPSPVQAIPALAAAATPTAQATRDNDDAFQADLRRSFLEGSPQTIANLRGLLHAYAKSETDGQRLARLQDLGRQTRALSSNAGIVGLPQLSRLAAAFEAFLKDLYEKPKNITPSTLRTVAQTVDFLGVLFEQGTASDEAELAAANILVVDDEIISRRAVTHALDKAGLKSVSVEDPLLALQLLGENSFDLVILDIEMPNMDGFQLCEKLRRLPLNASAPVIFVTSHTDFESRTKSIMSGGTDLIAKPFVFMELAVKSLTHILRHRLGKSTASKRDSAPPPSPPQPASKPSPEPTRRTGPKGLSSLR